MHRFVSKVRTDPILPILLLRGNLNLSMQDFMTVLRELEKDGLLEWFGDMPGLTENSLIA